LFCISVLFFFSEVFYIMSHLLFNIVKFHPEFIYFSLWCSLFHFGVYSGLLWFLLFVLVLSHIIYFFCLGIYFFSQSI
jgi:hypothetical protein